jgi:2-methylcitrate dehydratase PrpD
MNIEENLVKFVISVDYKDLPEEAIVGMKRLVLNSIAAMLAGTGASGVRELARLIRKWGGAPESTVFLNRLKVPAHEAVLVNATMIRALDFDDFHMQTGMHSGAIVLPVALAATELDGNTDGKALIAAMILGAEIMCRMRLVPDRCIGLSGWTGEIYGAFGGAITAGKILGLSREEMVNALGLAYSQAAGNAQTIIEGTLSTRLQQGFAARAGLLSAVMARAGLTGPKGFLEGKAGFYPVYYRGLDYDISRLVVGLEEKYEFLNLVTKLYPCCGFIMAPIENVLDIMRQNGITDKDIEIVTVHVNQQMYNTVCSPRENKYRPQTPADAMFSLPYTVSTAVLTGDVLLGDFSVEAIKKPDRLEFCNRIHIEIDDYIDRESKELNLPLALHEIRLQTKGGKHFSQKLYYAKGFPEKPMAMEEFFQKIKKCAPLAIKPFPEDKIEALRDIVINLEKQEDTHLLVELLY